MFKDAELDLTYPMKLPSSTIESEWLIEFPKIKYKRVCVLSGANASGKTALGKALCMINNYIDGRSVDQEGGEFNILNLPKLMYTKKSPALFYVEFLTPESGEMHQLVAQFDGEGLLEETYRVLRLRKSYSYSEASARLRETTAISHYKRKYHSYGISKPGFSSVAHSTGKLNILPAWNYQFSVAGSFERSEHQLHTKNTKIIKKFLCAFDSSISSVVAIDDDSYKIKFLNGESILYKNGQLLNRNRLSRGTLEAIEVAMFYVDILSWGKLEKNGVGKTYYLDEKLAYSHTEAEQAILNLLIETLPQNSQLFYTTHNYDILDMSLPAHSYTFLKKDTFSQITQPEKLGYNQNDRSLLGYVKNDVFGTLPNLDAINDLL